MDELSGPTTMLRYVQDDDTERHAMVKREPDTMRKWFSRQSKDTKDFVRGMRTGGASRFDLKLIMT